MHENNKFRGWIHCGIYAGSCLCMQTGVPHAHSRFIQLRFKLVSVTVPIGQ